MMYSAFPEGSVTIFGTRIFDPVFEASAFA